MNIDIRSNIKNNFKDNNIDEIKESINSAINDADEVTLPGMGVFFELLWNESNDMEKNNIIKKIKKSLDNNNSF